MVIGGAEAVPVVGGVGVGKVARAVRVKAEPMFVEAEVAR
jgi:hypothetical protein